MRILKTLFASISILVLLSVNVSAMGGKIGSPRIGHRGGINKAQTEKVHRLIRYMREELQFIDGSYINEFSNQRFGGTAEKTSRFFGLLEEAGIWEVEVVFRDFGEQESAFILHQDSSETLNVWVNSGRNDFLLKDFNEYLPRPGLGLGMRKAIQATAEQGDADQPAATPKSKSKDNQKPEPESERLPY